ncbi:MAG: hypothetical protein OEV48_10600 [Acidobacteriota bacterium]|nr:hypothetical protein [Acidobacteriota bacterium]
MKSASAGSGEPAGSGGAARDGLSCGVESKFGAHPPVLSCALESLGRRWAGWRDECCGSTSNGTEMPTDGSSRIEPSLRG